MSETTRIIYQSKYLAVGPSPAYSPHVVDASGDAVALATGELPDGAVNKISELYRIQNIATDWSIARQDVNEFGRLARIGSEIVEAPQTNLQFNYFVTDGYNERKLGFDISGEKHALNLIVDKSQDDRNYFILTVPQGEDAVNNDFDATSNISVVGVGNGFLSNYSLEASVGGFASASVSVEGRQFSVDMERYGDIPAVDPATGMPIGKFNIGTEADPEFVDPNYYYPTPVGSSDDMPLVLKHGDMTLEVTSAFGVNTATMAVQSVSFSLPLARETLMKLGTKFDYARELQFPLTSTMSINAIVTGYKGGKLSDVLCNDGVQDVTLTMREPACEGFGDIAMKITMKGVKIDSQNISVDIQGNEMVDMQLSAQIGSNEDTTNGVFLFGSRSVTPEITATTVNSTGAMFAISASDGVVVEYAYALSSVAMPEVFTSVTLADGAGVINLTGLTANTTYTLYLKGEKGSMTKLVTKEFTTSVA